MPVIAVVNRKGGSGKTTLATHLAASCAAGGVPVLLADADRQQSTQAWLRRRAAQKLPALATVRGRALEPNTLIRPPAGFAHVILDTPGGLRGFDLMRVVMYADAIVMPVGGSVFDRESTADCYEELKRLPRVAGGRCRVAAIGMRLDARTNVEPLLRDWAAALPLPFLGVLRETQAYVRCAERGLTLFDLPPAKVQHDLRQWQPILDWLAPVLSGQRCATTVGPLTSPLTVPRANIAARAPMPRPTQPATLAARLGRLIETLAVPRFLQRN